MCKLCQLLKYQLLKIHYFILYYINIYIYIMLILCLLSISSFFNFYLFSHRLQDLQGYLLYHSSSSVVVLWFLIIVMINKLVVYMNN